MNFKYASSVILREKKFTNGPHKRTALIRLYHTSQYGHDCRLTRIIGDISVRLLICNIYEQDGNRKFTPGQVRIDKIDDFK